MNRFNVCLALFLGVLCSTLATPTRPKVLMSNPTIPKIAFDILGVKCDLVKVNSDAREEILSHAKGVDAIFWATHEKLDKDILEAAGPQMKVIGTMSAGYNQIDTKELKARGIKLGNTPGVLSAAVADLAIFLALGASRRTHEGRIHIENGTWVTNESLWMAGQEVGGSTVGIIGLGRIGKDIAKRLKAFDVDKILYTGHKEKPYAKELGAKFVDLDTLTKDSDFIIVAVPLTNETNGMCNEEFFSKMKKTAVFINISRGAVVDQEALIRALKNGKIFAAGLDVMTPEPLPTDSELLKLPNLVLTPHIGSATVKTRNSMAELTAQNILRGLDGEEMLTPVAL